MTTDRNVLVFQCPFCGHSHSDEYECLESARPDVLRCESEGCRKEFAFLIRECLECGEESVFVWKSMPADETLALLSCNRCGAPFDEAPRQGESADPAQRL